MDFIPNTDKPGCATTRRRSRLHALILALACALAGGTAAAKDKPPVQYQIPLPAAPDFSRLDWLLGEWAGKTVGSSPAGEVRLSVALDLEKHFLIFRGEASLAATPTVPATKESWMGILSANPGGPGFTLQVFSSTGFMTRYRVTVDGPQVRLNPEGGDRPPPDWLFRRVLERTSPGEFTESVQAAPPAKPFFDYYTANLTRVPPAQKTTPAH
ncbi:MAG: hypothetical protein LAO04_11455 [Acidobacteriia bacterium]|nr:hypothetical protein [Terriglobia bacterium]